jgi:NHL repeat
MKPLATGGLIIALCGATLLCRALFAPSATARQNPVPRAINLINPNGLIYPNGLAIDDKGDLHISDIGGRRVLKLDRRGRLTLIAGTGEGGFGGDGGDAKKAQINLAMAVAASPDGVVYISDAANSRIRRVSPDGVIQTAVGYGPAQDTYGAGFAGDGGPAEKAKIFSATDLKFDAAGALYISDSGNNRIRVIRAGVVTTVAGSGRQGFSGDGGKAPEAELNTPQKVAVAKDGSLFIADRANHRVRKVDTRGAIITIAGAGLGAGQGARMMFDPAIR